jgi:hypothetical protein
MASIKKTFDAILSARSDQNVRFAQLVRVLVALGFDHRITGGHHIFFHPQIVEIVNLQPLRGGKAKAYQVKQVRELLTRYKLTV